MENEIKNRVANSKLVTLDLEEIYPKGERVIFEISQWLHEGMILREKIFREQVNNHDWSQYQDCYLAISNTSEAIIPAWAYMLITIHANPFAKKVSVGTLKELETIIFTEIICQLDLSVYKNKSVIIKGCAQKPIPENAFILLTQKLQPVVKSLMYGEACSSVPLFKTKK